MEDINKAKSDRPKLKSNKKNKKHQTNQNQMYGTDIPVQLRVPLPMKILSLGPHYHSRMFVHSFDFDGLGFIVCLTYILRLRSARFSLRYLCLTSMFQCMYLCPFVSMHVDV